MMQIKKPRWDLDRVKKLSETGRIHITKSKASIFFTCPDEAASAAKCIVADLTMKAYSKTDTLRSGIEADVYGVHYNNSSWFLKLAINEIDERLIIFSLHPPKYTIWTRGGKVLP